MSYQYNTITSGASGCEGQALRTALPEETSNQINSGIFLLTETEVSRILQLKISCLRRWRMERKGPNYLKVGSRVRYRMADVQAYIANCQVGGGSQ